MTPEQTALNDVESAIVRRIALSEPALAPLIDRLRVLSRERTGAGSYTDFAVDPDLASPALGNRKLILGALIVVPGLANGMGGALLCADGRPECLEMFTFDECWDGTFMGFRIEDD